jgi:hypothetical protein
MRIDRALRGVAGFLVAASVTVRHRLHPGLYPFTVFVGLNHLQSAFTRWCPMISLLRALGVRESPWKRTS